MNLSKIVLLATFSFSFMLANAEEAECKVRIPHVAGFSATWNGGCQNGYAHGQGSGKLYKNGRLIGEYNGMAQNGRPNGHGSALYVDKGARYEGNWVNGYPNGQGVKTWKTGDRYQGTFKDGERTGQGVYTWANGSRYEGQFVNGKLQGQGTFIPKKGTPQRGIWKENRLVNAN